MERRLLLSRKRLFLLAVLLLPTGCGPSAGEPFPAAVQAVDSRMLEQRGRITFVNEPLAASRLAQSLGRPSLLFFTAEWCTYCHLMEESAFMDPAVAALAENFVCVLVDADSQKKLCQYYSVQGYPTIQFVDPQGRTLNRLVGRQSAAALAGGMQSALQRQAWITGTETLLK